MAVYRLVHDIRGLKFRSVDIVTDQTPEEIVQEYDHPDLVQLEELVYGIWVQV